MPKRELVKVLARECPGCCFQLAQKEIEMHALNIDCPNCRKHKVSEFVISRTETYAPEPSGGA